MPNERSDTYDGKWGREIRAAEQKKKPTTSGRDRQQAHQILLSGNSRYFDPSLEDAIASALTTARKDAREAAWQPIETAPKDGTDVWLWIPDGREIPIVGRWEPLVVSRKVKWVTDGGMLEDRFPLPTHWMPLLKPPAAANNEEGGEDGRHLRLPTTRRERALWTMRD